VLERDGVSDGSVGIGVLVTNSTSRSSSAAARHNWSISSSVTSPSASILPNAPAYRIGIAVAWSLLTAVGIWAFMRYRSSHTRDVPVGLLAYSLLRVTTMFHFLGGIPDIPVFFSSRSSPISPADCHRSPSRRG
jgi:hypothetical protein